MVLDEVAQITEIVDWIDDAANRTNSPNNTAKTITNTMIMISTVLLMEPCIDDFAVWDHCDKSVLVLLQLHVA